VRIGSLTDDNLKPGYWRLLSPAEAARLMRPPKSPASQPAKPAQKKKRVNKHAI